MELFDRPSLRTCEDFEHLHFLRGLSDTATALLIECRGDSQEVFLSCVCNVHTDILSLPLSLSLIECRGDSQEVFL